MNHSLFRQAGRRLAAFCTVLALLTPPARPLQASEFGARINAARIFDALDGGDWNVRPAFALGFLHPGQSTVLRATLYVGNAYKIVAAGCEDAYDVDIAVYDENGNLVDKDNDTSPIAVVNVVPRWTSTCYIKVTMYRCTSDGAHYVVQLAYQ